MDVTGWMGIVSGLGGLFVGGYGAWRSWKTAHDLNLLAEKWRVSHYQRAARLLENRQTKAALDVHLTFPTGTSLSGHEGDLSRIEPGDAVKIVVFRSLGGGDLFDIEWRLKPGGPVQRTRLVLAPEPKS